MKIRTCCSPKAIGMVILLSLFCFLGISWADDFSADFVSASKDSSRMPGRGKMYMKGGLMRIEFPQAVTIARPDKGMVWMLMPGQNMYMERPYQPTPGMERWSPELEKRATKVGTESISGLRCTIYEIRGDQGTLRYWISDKIEFPVKMQDSSGSMRLENIKIDEVSGDLFEVPAGYRKFSMPSGGSGMPSGMGFPSPNN